MKTRALLFDLDGLIFDSEKVYYEKWKQAGLDCGYEIPHDVLLSMRACDSKLARKKLEQSLGTTGIYDAIRTRRKELMAEHIQNYQLEVKPGVREFLEKAATLPKVKKAVVTMSHKGEKEDVLRSAGLIQYFDTIITSEAVQRGKPYPDIFLHACSILHLEPGECIVFEDSPNGIDSASAAGIPTIMIPDMSQPDEELCAKCLAVYPNILDSWELVSMSSCTSV